MLEVSADEDVVVGFLVALKPLRQRSDPLLLGHQSLAVHHLLLHLQAHVRDVCLRSLVRVDVGEQASFGKRVASLGKFGLSYFHGTWI